MTVGNSSLAKCFILVKEASLLSRLFLFVLLKYLLIVSTKEEQWNDLLYASILATCVSFLYRFLNWILLIFVNLSITAWGG